MGRKRGQRLNRLDYLDFTKGFAMIFVVFGHALAIESTNYIMNWAYSFHMPIFFIISGCLLKYKENNGKRYTIKTKCYSLLIPYLYFCIANIIIEFILSKFNINIFIYGIERTVTFYGISSLWFVSALFMGEIVFLILKKKIPNEKALFFLGLILFIFPLIVGINHKTEGDTLKIIWSIGRGCEAFLFIQIGYHLFNYINNIKVPSIYLVILLLIVSITVYLNGFVNTFVCRYNNLFLFFINFIFMSLLLILLFKNIKQSKVLSWIGKNSLIIMATHQATISIIWGIMENLRLDYIGYLPGILVTLLVFIIEIPIVYVINNYLSFMIGKKNIKAISD